MRKISSDEMRFEATTPDVCASFYNTYFWKCFILYFPSMRGLWLASLSLTLKHISRPWGRSIKIFSFPVVFLPSSTAGLLF
jgi:hypothetical protein